MRERVTVVTLSVSQSVCLSDRVSLFYSGEGAVFRVETYISIHSSLSPLNVALFLKIEAILEKKRWNFGRNCSDVCGHRPVIKRFST